MNLPIGLTITRIVAVPFLILFLISSSRVHALIGAGIFTLAAFTDWLDGVLARRRNEVTTLGTLLDPIADKLLVAAALVSLLTIDKIAAWVVVVIIGRELAVTGLRTVAAGVGIIVPASRLAKWKTVSQYVAVTMLIVEKGFGSAEFPDLIKYTTLAGRAPDSYVQAELKNAETHHPGKWQQWQAKTPEQKAVLTLRPEDGES